MSNPIHSAILRVARGRGGDKVLLIPVVTKKNGDKRLVLISSSGNKLRWTFPKGTVEENETLEQVALEEAYEEGGLKIRKSSVRKVGEFKTLDGSTMTVFVGDVKKVLKSWPEHHERARKLVRVDKAAKMLKGSKKNKPVLKGLKAAQRLIGV